LADTQVCNIEPQYLDCRIEFSDRLVESRYFAPLNVLFDEKTRIPILTFRQKDIILSLFSPPEVQTWLGNQPPALREYFYAIIHKNSIPVPILSIRSIRSTRRDGTNKKASAKRLMQDQSLTMDSPSELQKSQNLDLLLNLVKSEVGYLFLDRTRIRPNGFAVGEHIYALSLAPGEEVAIEQKTFSKKETTLEEQTEQETQLDLELSSTLSTEMQEAVERKMSTSETKGLEAGGSLGGNVKGVDVHAELSYSDNITKANEIMSNRSVKNASTVTSRVAAKYRTQHKITFKVSTEERFEITSKRIIKNPNKYTPITLHYFKILRLFQMTQERYGVRLCWTPNIKDPGQYLAEDIRKAKEELIRQAEETISQQLPAKPLKPVKQQKPPKRVSSSELNANNWGATCDMSADYVVLIPIPAEYVWDGDIDDVRNSLVVDYSRDVTMRGPGYNIVGDPWTEGNPDGSNTLKIKVHVGVGSKGERIAAAIAGALTVGLVGPLAGAAVPCGDIKIRANATFVPNPTVEDPEYKKDLANWQNEMKEPQAKADDKRREAHEQVAKNIENLERDMINANPISKILKAAINLFFAKQIRDEAWEVDLWHKIFDWESASYRLYPGWWSDNPPRDITKEDTHFINASFAKLFLPIKPGFELFALRWIFGKVIDTKLDQNIESTFKKIEEGLSAFRETNFGHAQETNIVRNKTSRLTECGDLNDKYICLGRWKELMPTDGTHIEVVQSMTKAYDQITKDMVTENAALRQAIKASELEDVQIKKKATPLIRKEPNVQVNIETDRQQDTASNSESDRR
jgi:hypothetical protein